MPGHQRSFSNDRATLKPLEPRKHRRGASQHGWEPTTPTTPEISSEENERDAMPAANMHHRAGSASSALQDTESQRPLSPIDEKPSPGRGAGAGVTWMSLPRKDQLFILFISRLVVFLQEVTSRLSLSSPSLLFLLSLASLSLLPRLVLFIGL